MSDRKRLRADDDESKSDATTHDESKSEATVILDTDAGTDPDDLFAILCSIVLFGVHAIKLIVSANEKGSRRARFIRRYLQALGAGGVPVQAGIDLPEHHAFWLEELDEGNDDDNDGEFGRAPYRFSDIDDGKRVIVDSTGAPCTPPFLQASCDVIEAARADGNRRVTYICIGGFANLAALLEAHPEHAKSLDVYVMGGQVHPKPRSNGEFKAEFNARLDVRSTCHVFRTLCPNHSLTLVPCDTTVHPQLKVTDDCPLWASLKANEALAPAFELIRRNFAAFKAFTKYGDFFLHDPLTACLAAGLQPIVDMGNREPLTRVVRLRVDGDTGLMREDKDGDGSNVFDVRCMRVLDDDEASTVTAEVQSIVTNFSPSV